MLIITAMYHGLLEHHELKVLLHLKSELESIKRYALWNNFPNIWDQQYYEKSYK